MPAHLHPNPPRSPAPLLGLAVLRHQPPITALPMGHGVRRPAGRRPDRRAALTLKPPRWPTPHTAARVPRLARCASVAAELASARACPVRGVCREGSACERVGRSMAALGPWGCARQLRSFDTNDVR